MTHERRREISRVFKLKLRMMCNCLSIVAVCFGLVTSDTARGEMRVAMVQAKLDEQSGNSVPDVISLAEVLLANQSDVKLVDRATIDEVLAEYELSLQGLSDPAAVVQVGALLEADMLVVATYLPAKKRGPRPQDSASMHLSICSASTGAKAADLQIMLEDPQQAVETTMAAVLAAAKKADPKTGAMTVGLTQVRLLNLHPRDHPQAMAVSRLIERALIQSSTAMVLERQHLDWTTTERELAVLSHEQPDENNVLLASDVRVSLAFERLAQSGDRAIRVTMRLSDQEGEIDTHEAFAAEGDSVNLATTLTTALFEFLDSSPDDAFGPEGLPRQELDPTIRKKEAEALRRESEVLFIGRLGVPAYRAAATAHALDPNDDTRFTLAEIMMRLATTMVMPPSHPHGNYFGPGWQIHLTDRGHDAEPRSVARNAKIYPTPVSQGRMMLELVRGAKSVLAPHQNFWLVERRAYFFHRLPYVTTDDPAMQRELDQFRAERTETLRAYASCPPWQEPHRDSVIRTMQHIKAMSSFGDDLHHTISDPKRVVEMSEQLIEPILQGLAEHRVLPLDRQPRLYLSNSTHIFQALTAPFPRAPAPAITTNFYLHLHRSNERFETFFDRLEPLLTKYEQHQHPTVKLVGAYLRAHVAATRQRKAVPEELQAVESQSKAILGSSESRPPKQMITDAFRIWNQAIDAAHRYEPHGKHAARLRLWQYMIEQKLLIRFNWMGRWFDWPNLEPQQLMSLIRQTQALLDDPKAQIIGPNGLAANDETRQKFKESMRDHLVKIQGRQSELIDQQVQPVWSKIERLLPVGEKPRVRYLTVPVVHGDKVYVINHAPVHDGLLSRQLIEVDLSGGAARVVSPFVKQTGDTGNPSWSVDAPVVCEGYVVEPLEGGRLIVYPLNGDAAYMIDESNGLPGDRISSIAGQGDWVYIGVADSLIAYRPKDRAWRTIASAKSPVARNPLERPDKLYIGPMIADPNRPVLYLYASAGYKNRFNGIWRYDTQANTFERITRQGQRGYWPLQMYWNEPDTVLCYQRNRVDSLDIVTGKAKTLFETEIRNTREWPCAVINNELWIGEDLSRVDLETGERTPLPNLLETHPLPRGTPFRMRRDMVANRLIRPVPDGRVLIAGQNHISVVTPLPDQKRQTQDNAHTQPSNQVESPSSSP